MARRVDDFDRHLLVADENSELRDGALAASFSEWLREWMSGSHGTCP